VFSVRSTVPEVHYQGYCVCGTSVRDVQHFSVRRTAPNVRHHHKFSLKSSASGVKHRTARIRRRVHNIKYVSNPSIISRGLLHQGYLVRPAGEQRFDSDDKCRVLAQRNHRLLHPHPPSVRPLGSSTAHRLSHGTSPQRAADGSFAREQSGGTETREGECAPQAAHGNACPHAVREDGGCAREAAPAVAAR